LSGYSSHTFVLPLTYHYRTTRCLPLVARTTVYALRWYIFRFALRFSCFWTPFTLLAHDLDVYLTLPNTDLPTHSSLRLYVYLWLPVYRFPAYARLHAFWFWRADARCARTGLPGVSLPYRFATTTGSARLSAFTALVRVAQFNGLPVVDYTFVTSSVHKRAFALATPRHPLHTSVRFATALHYSCLYTWLRLVRLRDTTFYVLTDTRCWTFGLHRSVYLRCTVARCRTHAAYRYGSRSTPVTPLFCSSPVLTLHTRRFTVNVTALPLLPDATFRGVPRLLHGYWFTLLGYVVGCYTVPRFGYHTVLPVATCLAVHHMRLRFGCAAFAHTVLVLRFCHYRVVWTLHTAHTILVLRLHTLGLPVGSGWLPITHALHYTRRQRCLRLQLRATLPHTRRFRFTHVYLRSAVASLLYYTNHLRFTTLQRYVLAHVTRYARFPALFPAAAPVWFTVTVTVYTRVYGLRAATVAFALDRYVAG